MTRSQTHRWCVGGIALLAGLLACAALLGALARPAWAAPAQVRPYPGANPCDSTLQACIDGSNPGDTIVVQPGTYDVLLTLNKAVSLTGVTSNTTILRGPGFSCCGERALTIMGAAVHSGVVISGLTILGGGALPSLGGGILITDGASPLLANVIISGHFAFRGGGVYAHAGSHLRLQGVRFIGNISGGRGGGAYAGGAASVSHSRFLSNTAFLETGGGLHVAGALALTDTQFISNVASTSGGGAYAGNAVTVQGGLFHSNTCSAEDCQGGGLYAVTSLELTDTQFIHNTSYGSGGGVNAVGPVTLNGGLFQGNQCLYGDCEGGGLHIGGTPLALTSTQFISNVAGYSGGGVSASGPVILRGGLFQGNSCWDLKDGCYGGGLSTYWSLDLDGAQFVSNQAWQGGGVATTFNGNGQVANSLFAGNSAAGGDGAAMYLAVYGSTTLLHNTVASAALAGQSAIFIANGTVSALNNLVSLYAVGWERASGTVNENFTLFSGVATHYSGTVSGGASSFDGLAGFVNAAGGDFRLGAVSDAINAGTDAGLYLDAFGTARPAGAGFDIGFHEFDPFLRLYLPLILR